MIIGPAGADSVAAVMVLIAEDNRAFALIAADNQEPAAGDVLERGAARRGQFESVLSECGKSDESWTGV